MANLVGTRIYLEMPKQDESKVIVDENTKEALQKELLKKMSRLKVHSIGSGVNDDRIKVGMEVLVDPIALRDKAVVIPKQDGDVMLVSYFDIIEIY